MSTHPNSNDLRNVLFRPDKLLPADPRYAVLRFTNKSFNNVSFAKTTISRVIFTNCKFEDCLFIGTTFIDCEFHECTFKGCNSHKVAFENTYIDPSVFEDMLDPVDHWNIGIHLFQELYDNSIKMNQREFADAAEFNRSKWRRYLLNHRYAGWKERTSLKYIKGWLTNYLFYIFAGYGIRFRFLAFWMSIAIAVSVGVNLFFLDSLNIVGRDGPVVEKQVVDVLYYTATIPTGIGEFASASDFGRWVFLIEAFVGFIIASLFVTWLVKRALR